MYSDLITLCIIPFLTVHGLDFFGINNGYHHLLKRSIPIASVDTISSRWIEQKLDNFDSNENRTWQMRYFEETKFWKPNGPIYLFLVGQSAADFLRTGILYELAEETGGAIFISEHRYYGASQPLKGSKVEDMKFLSASQALADNENLLRTIKKNDTFKDSKVVVIGGFYAGNLAAWMRLVYPNLVDAAIASSSPVLAKRDFYEYFEVVNNDYKKYGSEGCLENIENMFQEYEMLFQTDEGIAELKKQFKICEESDLTKSENKQLFFYLITNYFAINAELGTPYTIYDVCSTLNNTRNTYVLSYYKKYLWNDENDCNDIDFNYMMQLLQRFNDFPSWIYQTCTEFGYFQSTSSDHQPFTKNIPVEWYQKICTSMYGPDFDKDKVDNGAMNINKMYGGRSPNVTKVVFVNGELDPWHSLSVLEDISNDATAVFIPRVSHCRDLLSTIESDSEELKEARVHIKYLIKKWIRAYD